MMTLIFFTEKSTAVFAANRKVHSATNSPARVAALCRTDPDVIE